MAVTDTAYGSFVALGDSFTEGLADIGPDGGYRGWADRLAERLALHRAAEARRSDAGRTEAGRTEAGRTEAGGGGGGSPPEVPFRYANLAVRGKLLAQVAGEQVDRAVSLRPDLVSIAAGGNDLIRPNGAGPEALADMFEAAVARLRAAGATVVVLTGPPPPFPLLRRAGGRIALYNLHLRAIADRHDCLVLDLWAMRPLRDQRLWGVDRLHLSGDGHHRVELRAAEVLGLPVEEDWREPLPPPVPMDRAHQWREDLHWTREYLLPWVRRRLRGESSGDNVAAKRPDLAPLGLVDRGTG